MICQDDLREKIQKDKISDYYKYNYKIVSRTDFASFIEGKDSKYFYTVPTPFMMSPTKPNKSKAGITMTVSGIMYSNQIVDCYSGRIIGLVMNSEFVGALGASSYEKVNKKSLKKMEEFLKTYYFK
ncbi:MAG: hypothetical protein HRT73_15265 [Flavobacteriales bacterium]|nr:hypothetical protein [Flavobacteriales bacterium]